MGVKDVRSKYFRELFNGGGRGRHFLEKDDTRSLRKPVRPHWRTVESPAIDVLDLGGGTAVPWRRELQRFPTARPLFAQDCKRPKRITAVRRKRVVEDVNDAHGAVMRPRGTARRRRTGPRRYAGRHRT